MAKKKRQYPCSHCQTLWDELYLAELCYKVDMENLITGGTRNAKDKASHWERRT